MCPDYEKVHIFSASKLNITEMIHPTGKFTFTLVSDVNCGTVKSYPLPAIAKRTVVGFINAIKNSLSRFEITKYDVGLILIFVILFPR